MADDDALRARIDEGDFDDDVAGLAVALAADVRDQLAIVNPSWLRDGQDGD